MSKSRYRATVLCEIRIEVSDAWGSDCTMDQIERQAMASANGIMRNLACIAGIEDDTIEKKRHKRATMAITPLRITSVTATKESNNG